MKKACTVSGCDLVCYGHGYCMKHYTRWRRHGDPLAGAASRRKGDGYCVECGTPSPTTFCSKLCRGRGNRKQSRGVALTRRCAICRGPMPVELSMLQKHCSSECLRIKMKAWKAGLDPHEVYTFLVNHPRLCSICGMEGDLELALDHCHKTGRMRGLLCSNCNVAIGLFGEDTDRLRMAILYLEVQRGEVVFQEKEEALEEVLCPQGAA